MEINKMHIYNTLKADFMTGKHGIVDKIRNVLIFMMVGKYIVFREYIFSSQFIFK